MEEKKKVKACRDLIQETARKLKRKIDEESQKRMDALYEKMKKRVVDTNQSLVAISKLEETLQRYTRDLGIVISGMIALKS